LKGQRLGSEALLKPAEAAPTVNLRANAESIMFLRQPIHLSRRRSVQARSPEHGAWPAEMRSSTAAAFFDFATTGELMKAVERGEAPPPTAQRRRAGKLEPVWALELCLAHIARRHEIDNDPSLASDNIGSLV
jgi:hypothetical protein